MQLRHVVDQKLANKQVLNGNIIASNELKATSIDN